MSGVVLSFAALAAAQFSLKNIIKVGGIIAVVNTFGKDINKGINKIASHTDSVKLATKVVPILSIGVGKSSAIGIAQVMGPPDAVARTVAVAQPEADLLGREVRIRALIPVASKDITKGISRVDGVGVSGIVDLKL